MIFSSIKLIDNVSINPKSLTGKLFERFFYQDYHSDNLYVGKNYRYSNISMFNYADINDPHSSKSYVFQGMLLKLKTSKYFENEKYLLSNSFFFIMMQKRFLIMTNIIKLNIQICFLLLKILIMMNGII